MHRAPLSVLVLVSLLATPSFAKEPRPDYPATRTEDVVDVLHGDEVADPFRWLEDDDASDVAAWDRAQHDLMRRHVERFPDRAQWGERIEAELGLGGMPSLPRFHGGRRFYTYRPKGADHGIVYVTDEADEKGERGRVVLDPNAWSEDKTAGLDAWQVSPDGSYVAYRRDSKGSEDTTLFVRDVVTGRDLPVAIPRTKFSPIVWDEDGTGFFYSRMPDPALVPDGQAQYHRRIRYHRLGTLPIDDPIVFGQGTHFLLSKWIYSSSDEQHLFVTKGMPYEDIEIYQLRWDGRNAEFTPITEGYGGQTYVDRAGGRFLINTDRNVSGRELFIAHVGEAGEPVHESNWKSIFRAQSNQVVEDAFFVDDEHVIVHFKEDVVSRLHVARHDKPTIQVELPGPGTIGRFATKPGSPWVWFSFDSYSRPLTTYKFDASQEKPRLQALNTIPTTIDVDNLVSEQTTYKSKDGTEIPIFLVRRKDTKYDGSAPTVLYGYGGFRVGLFPRFSRSRAIWAEKGGIWAVACLRGGIEYGEAWHEDGALENKQNVFDDFIAGADWLVKTGKTSRDKLAIWGGSNGGLLVAAVVNQRPDLCAAGVCSVPLTDMLRYHRFQYAKSWTKELGDPDKPDEYAYIKTWSPYHNVPEGKCFPSMLVTAGLHDGRVNAFHARKIVAQWQRATTCANPILLRLDREAGHGAASVKHYQKELLDTYSFVWMELSGGE